MNHAGARNDDLILVEGENSTGVAESEFVKDFNHWKDGHRKKNHFRIKCGAEDFLELRKTGDQDEILALEYALNVSSDKIDRIARQDGQLILVEFFNGICNSDFGDRVFRKIARV